MNEEEGRGLRIVTEVMEEREICETCGADTGGGSVKTVSSTGVVLKILCHECSDAVNLEEYGSGRELTMRLVMASIVARDPSGPLKEIRESYERIAERIKLFEERVWFGGLQAENRECHTKGMSMVHDGMSLLVFSMAGRTMITIQDDDGDVTLIADETSGEPTMGLQGVHGTESKAAELMGRAEAAWVSGARPRPDREIRPL